MAQSELVQARQNLAALTGERDFFIEKADKEL